MKLHSLKELNSHEIERSSFSLLEYISPRRKFPSLGSDAYMKIIDRSCLCRASSINWVNRWYAYANGMFCMAWTKNICNYSLPSLSRRRSLFCASMRLGEIAVFRQIAQIVIWCQQRNSSRQILLILSNLEPKAIWTFKPHVANGLVNPYCRIPLSKNYWLPYEEFCVQKLFVLEHHVYNCYDRIL